MSEILRICYTIFQCVRTTSILSKPERNFIILSKLETIRVFLKGSKRFFICAVICSILVAFLDMVSPKVVQYTVDYVLGSEEVSSGVAYFWLNRLGGSGYLRAHLYVIAAIVIGLGLLGAVLRFMYRMFNSMGAERLLLTMRDSLFYRIEHLPLSWHEKNHTGDIIQRCTSDVETIRNFISEQLMALFRVAILIGLGVYFMININPALALVSGAFIPVIIAYSVFFHNKIADSFLHADEEEGRLSSIAQENLTGVRVVRAFGREQYERDRFENKNRDYTKMWIRLMGWLSAFWCSNDFIAGLQVMLVTVVGAVFCVKGYLSVGGYIAFASYNGILSWPVRELGRIISDMSKAGISIDRIRYIMNSPMEDEEDSVTSAVPDHPADIEFDHVSFSYDNGEKVLDDINLKIPAGSILGVLGSTGSGKSTLMYLLDRLYELGEDEGCIRLGGRNITEYDRQELRRHIGLVLQEPYLFSGTLAENIAITGEGTPDMTEVRRASRIAALEDTADRFNDGFDTFVGERGVTLSGGQKQRTAIAQSIASKPCVYIFDDSLSAVDAHTDALIRANLLRETEGVTVILISHRINSLSAADNIIVMDHGRIAESGTHDELVELGGIYRRIYDLQMAGADQEK